MKTPLLLLLILLLNFNPVYSQNDSLTASSDATLEKTEFEPDKAIQDYLNSLSAEEKEKSNAYFEGGYWLLFWGLLVELLIAYIFLNLGLSQWIRRIAEKVGNVNLKNLAYILFYSLLAYMLAFPFIVYKSFFREHQYDLSNLTFGGWFGEEMTGLSISLVFGSLAIMLLYIGIRKTGKAWWLWGTGGSLIFLVIMIYLGPVFINPLFNDYYPLEEGPVKEEILSMARANGVPAEEVYQFDASKQTDRISANVSGIGHTIRISLNDNLLNTCTTGEIKAVMAHELGHYVLNHIFKLLFYITALILVGFAFVDWSFHLALKKWGDRWKISGLSDIGGLPLFLVLFTIYFFLAKPVMNNIIRVHEYEADIFGLNAANEPDGFASVAMKLASYRKISPGAWEEIIFFDHPSGKTRVSAAMRWKAENLEP